jgi:hypothetical protein
LSKLPAAIELQFEGVRTRIEALRLTWLQSCDRQCFPPVELDLDNLQREFMDLEQMVREAMR